jgi:hypothetical protein
MLAPKNRLLTVLALLLAGTCVVALAGPAAAGDRDDVVYKGVFDGVWHGGQMKLSVEKMNARGEFSGTVHFDPKSPWPDATFLFSGRIGRDDSLTIRRVNDDWDQVARTGPPRREGDYLVWKGEVTGTGLDKPLPFELRVRR